MGVLIILLFMTYTLGGIMAVKFMKIVIEVGMSEDVTPEIMEKVKCMNKADVKWTIFLIWPVVALTIPTRFDDTSAL